jgi:hypothetical protein
MKLSRSLAALMLAAVAGSAFAAGTAPATTPVNNAKPAATKPAHKAKAALHCKEGEAVVKGKCEKKPA